MQKALIFLSLSLLTLITPKLSEKDKTQDKAVTTYYLIRHAEKDRSDKSYKNPHLTEAGLKRANNWAQVLKDIDLDAVYSTNYNRTKETAAPVAENKKLEIQIYDASDLYNEAFKKATAGMQVLVVGHSNTTPQLANKIIKSEKYTDIDDSENGALFIIQVYPDGSNISKVLYIN
ncbi:SixA phosphatase family protein [Christiangramia salexigens]|uniref:Phosphoglycerate mutase n=1 Tax=Christiangramia salexigens TaxID=1913577 RepID=A0A1L3J4D2_9FLAO|nr:histidine phosphatase family protein [Christiangramia salexigens]APG59976.1 phosphoglycerate mutase [Christiangramia salexigens]